MKVYIYGLPFHEILPTFRKTQLNLKQSHTKHLNHNSVLDDAVIEIYATTNPDPM